MAGWEWVYLLLELGKLEFNPLVLDAKVALCRRGLDHVLSHLGRKIGGLVPRIEVQSE